MNLQQFAISQGWAISTVSRLARRLVLELDEFPGMQEMNQDEEVDLPDLGVSVQLAEGGARLQYEVVEPDDLARALFGRAGIGILSKKDVEILFVAARGLQSSDRAGDFLSEWAEKRLGELLVLSGYQDA